MNKRLLGFYLVLFSIVLTSCTSMPDTKPTVILDAKSYTNEGIQAFLEADWNLSKGLFTRALSLYQGIDDQQGVLFCQINLAEVALSVNDYPATQRHLDLASEISKNTSLQLYQARINLLYALNALKQKKTTQAEDILQSLLPVFDGDTPGTIPDNIQITAIANRTKIAFVQKLDEAIWTQRYANALKLSSIKNPNLEARLLRFQSSLLQRQGSFEQSESKLQKALFEYKKNSSRSGIAETLLELGELYRAEGLWQRAKNHLNRSITVFRYLNNLDKVIQVTEILVIVETELGHLKNSKRLNQWIIDMKELQLKTRGVRPSKVDNSSR